MATQTERRNATRGAILDAATSAYEGGDLSVALDEIATIAGVTKGTIFYHFESRAGLLRAVAERALARLEARLAREVDDIDVMTWVRRVLSEQASPMGRLLFAINDELAPTKELIDADPYLYLTARLDAFGVRAPATLIAAAMLQYARQLAFDAPSAGTIDSVMADLEYLL